MPHHEVAGYQDQIGAGRIDLLYDRMETLNAHRSVAKVNIRQQRYAYGRSISWPSGKAYRQMAFNR